MKEQSVTKKVFIGSYDALKKVPEWQTKQVMRVYDRYFLPSFKTKEEKQVAEKTRKQVEQWVHRGVVGVDAAVILGAIVLGYKKIRQHKQDAPLSIHTVPIDSVPLVQQPIVERAVPIEYVSGTIVPYGIEEAAHILEVNQVFLSQVQNALRYLENPLTNVFKQKTEIFTLASIYFAANNVLGNPNQVIDWLFNINTVFVWSHGEMQQEIARYVSRKIVTGAPRQDFSRPIGLLQSHFRESIPGKNDELVRKSYDFYRHLRFPMLFSWLRVGGSEPEIRKRLEALYGWERGWNPVAL